MAEWHSTLTPHALARQLPAPDGRRPAYRALAAQVSRLVADGRLPVGTRLPAERELAAELHLSRTTVAAAYEALRADGYLRSRRGAGSWTALPEGTSPPADALHPVSPEQGAVLDLGLAAPTPRRSSPRPPRTPSPNCPPTPAGTATTRPGCRCCARPSPAATPNAACPPAPNRSWSPPAR
ncbi:winged helix-turn-helix domain-containing protein [Kitasatospora sp. YST-16]|nr:winged helix-turn-helix domain-containing protein [Kitasatospora sp. YST-16]WAL74460.1 winged helix-turn-helix domain-containing protein [Kitasatospora sp. YST-16]WNW40526.1 winged helix-turn-helix domain-containing protein [Streptomyces sp. Li-HN-5-13]